MAAFTSFSTFCASTQGFSCAGNDDASDIFLPSSRGIRSASGGGTKKTQGGKSARERSRREKTKGDTSPRGNKWRKTRNDVIAIFSEAFREKYGVGYVPSEADSKAVYYNLVDIIEGDNEAIEQWRRVAHLAMEVDIPWAEEDVDNAGRPTLRGVINRYNDLVLITSDSEGASEFYALLLEYRKIWSDNEGIAQQCATRELHRRGYRLSQIQPELLQKLKRRYSNADLGLQYCPPEDAARVDDEEIWAEILGNSALRTELYQEAARRSPDGTLTPLIPEIYRERHPQ